MRGTEFFFLGSGGDRDYPDNGWAFEIHDTAIAVQHAQTVGDYLDARQAATTPTPSETMTTTPTPASIERNVFVVHGRNQPAADAMFTFLRALDLRPMEFDDAVALTGSAAPYIGEILDAAFKNAQAVVVLLTPDEVAYLRAPYAEGPDDPETKPTNQARPNVLFEAGMALGSHPTRTVVVELGQVRRFSDAAGRHTVKLNGSAEALQRIAQRLETAGCPVDRSGTDWMNTTIFVNPDDTTDDLPRGRKIPGETPGRRIGIDLRFHAAGNSGRLHVTNTGTELLHNIDLRFPDEVKFFTVPREDALPIQKLPAGKTARLLAIAMKSFGSNGPSNFEVHVTATTSDGDDFEDDVFLDIGG